MPKSRAVVFETYPASDTALSTNASAAPVAGCNLGGDVEGQNLGPTMTRRSRWPHVAARRLAPGRPRPPRRYLPVLPWWYTEAGTLLNAPHGYLSGLLEMAEDLLGATCGVTNDLPAPEGQDGPSVGC